jgi:hypothetical protein
MSGRRNVAASVRQRLYNLSVSRGEEFQLVLSTRRRDSRRGRRSRVSCRGDPGRSVACPRALRRGPYSLASDPRGGARRVPRRRRLRRRRHSGPGGARVPDAARPARAAAQGVPDRNGRGGKVRDDVQPRHSQQPDEGLLRPLVHRPEFEFEGKVLARAVERTFTARPGKHDLPLRERQRRDCSPRGGGTRRIQSFQQGYGYCACPMMLGSMVVLRRGSVR